MKQLFRIVIGACLTLAFISSLAVDAATLAAVQSRKAHGSPPTDYNLPIDTTRDIGDAVTVEPRAIGPGHQIVFQFDGPVTAVGTPTATDESGSSAGSVAVSPLNGNEAIVTLTGVPDNKRIKVVLPNVNGGANAQVSLGFLVGDVDNTRSISSNDVQQIKARSGQRVDTLNFRFDLNASGVISAADVIAARNRAPAMLTGLTVAATFTTQPASITVTAGQTAQFVAVANGTPAPTLQWQSSTDSGANWNDIAGAIGNGYSFVSALSDSGRQYRAVATNSVGSVNSNAATLTVNAAPLPKAWQPASLMSAAIDGDVYNYQIAFSANGDAIAVWQDLVSGVIATNIWANRYTPATGWGVPGIIDAGPYDARDAQIGMDASGNAIAVWAQSDGVYDYSSGSPVAVRYDIWSNRFVAGSSWSGATLLETLDGDASTPQIAVSANGQAIASWSQRNAGNSGADTITRSFHPASGWGTTTTLATGTDAIVIVGGFGVVGNPGPASVAMDAGGNSMALWAQLAGTQIDLVASRNGTPAELVKANVGPFLGYYRVASNAAGETIASWQRCGLWANRYTPGTGWGAATALQSGNPSCNYAPYIQVAVAANGDAIAAAGSLGARYTAGSGWQGATPLSNGANFHFAMNGAGNALAAWQSASILAGNNVYVTDYNFFPSVQIFGGSGIDTTGLAIAMDPNGNAIVLFKRADVPGVRNTIWSAVYK